MSTQSTQYNAVQEPYDELRKGSISIIERVNIRLLVLPFVKDANVLDLACGSGSYSHAFIKWGAKRVLGVDISSGMLNKAKALCDHFGDADHVDFVEADCSKPTAYEGGPVSIMKRERDSYVELHPYSRPRYV